MESSVCSSQVSVEWWPERRDIWWRLLLGRLLCRSMESRSNRLLLSETFNHTIQSDWCEYRIETQWFGNRSSPFRKVSCIWSSCFSPLAIMSILWFKFDGVPSCCLGVRLSSLKLLDTEQTVDRCIQDVLQSCFGSCDRLMSCERCFLLLSARDQLLIADWIEWAESRADAIRCICIVSDCSLPRVGGNRGFHLSPFCLLRASAA